MTPRVLFVGRGRLALPLAPWLQRKWDALAEVLELRVLNAGTGASDTRFRIELKVQGKEPIVRVESTTIFDAAVPSTK